MKKLTYILLIPLLVSCFYENEPDYNYIWNIKVVYTDSSIDTLDVSRKSFNGNTVALYLNIAEPGMLSDAGTVPCIVTHCGFYKNPVVCGVRRFEIIQFQKIQI